MKGDRGDEVNALTHDIIKGIITVHRVLGPGFIESIYQRALIIELTKLGPRVATEFDVPVEYDGQLVGRHRLDLVVNDLVIVELKTVEDLSRAHYAQVRSYLRATGLPIALLVNFATEMADYRRIEYG